MWLMTPFGFFSIVAAYTPAEGYGCGLRMIRARKREHLVALRTRHPHLPAILQTDNTDYPYRIVADAGDVTRVVMALAEDICYGNFKAAAKATVPEDGAYHDFLHTVWRAGLGLTPKVDYTHVYPGFFDAAPPPPRKARARAKKKKTKGKGKYKGALKWHMRALRR